MKIVATPLGRLGANTYILSNPKTKEAVVIDCGGDAHKLLNYFDEKGLKLVAIILTHGHSDHIEGVPELREATGATVIAHEAEVEMLANPSYNLSNNWGQEGTSLVADQLVKEGDVLELIGEKMEIFHTPGHTRGGMCILVGDDLFVGDTLFAGSIGRTDLYGGDMNTMRKTLAKIKTWPKRYKVYPGHGPVTTLRNEIEYNPYLANV